jgi:hypothetical protein
LQNLSIQRRSDARLRHLFFGHEQIRVSACIQSPWRTDGVADGLSTGAVKPR